MAANALFNSLTGIDPARLAMAEGNKLARSYARQKGESSWFDVNDTERQFAGPSTYDMLKQSLVGAPQTVLDARARNQKITNPTYAPMENRLAAVLKNAEYRNAERHGISPQEFEQQKILRSAASGGIGPDGMSDVQVLAMNLHPDIARTIIDNNSAGRRQRLATSDSVAAAKAKAEVDATAAERGYGYKQSIQAAEAGNRATLAAQNIAARTNDVNATIAGHADTAKTDADLRQSLQAAVEGNQFTRDAQKITADAEAAKLEQASRERMAGAGQKVGLSFAEKEAELKSRQVIVEYMNPFRRLRKGTPAERKLYQEHLTYANGRYGRE